jgi:phytoene dehydrogenase-like protein
MPDAVVIGSGPNGMAGANVLADAGWDVVVLEAQPEPGGAVRTGELTLPGWRHDLFSAFYPLGAASPVFRDMRLDDFGLAWSRAPLVLSHPFPGGRAAVMSTDVDETAASLDQFAAGDGDAWRALFREWQGLRGAMVDALLRPFPPVGPALRLAGRLRTPGNLLDFARMTLLPVRQLAAERFSGEGAGILLAGNTLHADLAPESALGGIFAWILCMLGQEHGFPVPRGGAGSLIGALQRRLESRGGRVECDARVTSVVVRRGRAVAVRTADGREVEARRAVLADVVAPRLFLDLVGPALLPARLVAELGRFRFDSGTVKVDWALDRPIPWEHEATGRAGTVHVGGGMDHLTEFSAQLAAGVLPARPFLLFGQMTTADPTRSPPGTETAWGYTHVPHQVRGDAGGSLSGRWDDKEADAYADRMEEQVEALAPGFRDGIVARHVFTPPTMEAADANLVGGAVNGGAADLHQQLVFRPTPSLRGRPETPVRGLYLASASAHPGGGVHGACGANAARAALWHDRLRRVTTGLVGARSRSG